MSVRIIKLSLLKDLRQHCPSLLPRLALKKRYLSPSAVSGSSLSYIKTPVRSFSIDWPKWNDVPQPKDQGTEKLDLDVWKSVMRSQVAQEEKLRDSDDNTGQSEAGEMSQEDSALEATRGLVEMWRQAGKQVPEHITTEQLEIVAELSTKSAKKKYLKFLAIKEGYKKANKKKQEKKRMEWLEREKIRKEEGDDEGSKPRNTFILQFWQQSLDRLLGWQSIQAMRFGQPLVFDMNYESQMTRREIENTVSQLMATEGLNRRSVEPFHLHFCNLNPEGEYHKELLKRYGVTLENILITSSPKSHIDMFPRDQLVYLTADSPNVLRTFDHNKVYIIGALVDRSNLPGVSLATAKRLKLTTARLPLDEHLRWECGGKNLSLDQMFSILMTVKETGNWDEALKYVPQRKHSGIYTAKKNSIDSKGKKAKASPLANRDSKDLFISKQRSRGQGESKVPPQSPITAILKRKVAAPTNMAKKNWWDD